jgi:two-component system cell cycle response regulator DivK
VAYAVVIIDDNAQNLKLARDVLQFHGFSTFEAETAAEGIELARTVTPDVVLMDVQLPDCDGVSALAELRRDARTAAVPVVALTAFAMKGDRERFMAAGFDGYLAKPIEIRTFPKEVAAYCQANTVETA